MWRGTKSQLGKSWENAYKINELVEKPPREKAPSNLAIMGRYVLTPDIFDKIDETEAGVGGEIQLTDAYEIPQLFHWWKISIISA